MSEARSVLGVICSFYDSFFEAEKKIADYIMEHKAQAVDMTVGELARASGTSDATVSRFCRRCGFKGFQSLKLALAREVLREEQDSRKVTNDIDRENLSQSLNNIQAKRIAEQTETVRMKDIKSLEEILKKLEKARMVQLAAVGNTIPVALDGAFKFNQLGIPSVAGDIWETQAAYTFNLGPEDVVLLISNSGFSQLSMMFPLRSRRQRTARSTKSFSKTVTGRSIGPKPMSSIRFAMSSSGSTNHSRYSPVTGCRKPRREACSAWR